MRHDLGDYQALVLGQQSLNIELGLAIIFCLREDLDRGLLRAQYMSRFSVDIVRLNLIQESFE